MCFETAMTQCLKMGGEHVEPEHFRLMLNCAALCRVAAEFVMTQSEFHERLCDLCASVCEACATSCREIGGMDLCARACEACAESCASMAVASPREPLLTHPLNRP
jgi:hypothetical protein